MRKNPSNANVISKVKTIILSIWIEGVRVGRGMETNVEVYFSRKNKSQAEQMPHKTMHYIHRKTSKMHYC